MFWISAGFKHDEQHRPEFRGTAMPSIVTGRTTLFFDEGKKRRAIIISVVGIATMVVGSINWILKFGSERLKFEWFELDTEYVYLKLRYELFEP